MTVYANLSISYSSELSLKTIFFNVLPLKSLQCVSRERKETHGGNVYDQIKSSDCTHYYDFILKIDNFGNFDDKS